MRESTSVPAQHVRPRKVAWAWRNIVPAGMLTVIAGAPGTRKSLLAVLIAAEVSRRRDVIFAAAEDPHEEVVVPRLIAAGAKLENVTLWEAFSAGQVDLAELDWHIRKLSVGLLVLDPLTAFVSASRSSLIPLAKLAKESGCAVIGIHHTIKGGNSRSALEKIAGSTGSISGTARAVYVFGPNPLSPELERVLAPVKVNVGPEPSSISFTLDLKTVERGPFKAEVPGLRIKDLAVSVDAGDVLYQFDEGGYSEELIAVVAEWLTEELARTGKVSLVELEGRASLVGFGPGLLRATARYMSVVTLTTTSGRTTWELPRKHPLRRKG